VNDYVDEFPTVLRELSSLILSEENLQTTLQRVVELSAQVVPGSAAGVLLTEDGRTYSTAVTSDVATDLHAIQQEIGDGPCLTAMRTRKVIHIADMTEETRWPEFTTAALDRGIKAMLCFPLVVRNESLGALNLFSEHNSTFVEEVFDVGAMFAAQASVSIHNSQLYLSSVKLTDQLKEALESRAVIDQAKGILMEREGLSPDAAFEMLRKASQNLNVKVRDIAAQIVARLAGGEPE
jgi:GAF domain-containing protein